MQFYTLFKIIYAMIMIFLFIIMICTIVAEVYFQRMRDKDNEANQAQNMNRVNIGLSGATFVVLLIFGICWFFISGPRTVTTQITTYNPQ
jgi:heme/copper-type cytochrome/quinol oxidase subunit 2